MNVRDLMFFRGFLMISDFWLRGFRLDIRIIVDLWVVLGL